MPVLHDPHDGFHGLAAVPASLCKADQRKALLVSVALPGFRGGGGLGVMRCAEIG